MKKIIFSGVQPSGKLTLGNYLGAIKNWVAMQEDYDCLYCVVDMHAITVRQDPKKLYEQTLEVLAQYIACGLDPEKSTLFIQSHVPAHAELGWVLNCYAMYGELARMTQFKDKSAKHAENITGGLFTYPTLMASDILLYQPDLVPIGIDQKQHVELCRNIATRFNNIYGETFKIPEPYMPKVGAKIMSLNDPTKKMSKSDTNANGYILLTDTPQDIMKKFKKATTDSLGKVCMGEDNYGIQNLMSIYSVITGKTLEEIEKEFEGQGYGAFKPAVGEAVCEALKPIREKTDYLLTNKDYLEKVYKEGAIKAQQKSSKTLEDVYAKVGFIKK